MAGRLDSSNRRRSSNSGFSSRPSGSSRPSSRTDATGPGSTLRYREGGGRGPRGGFDRPAGPTLDPGGTNLSADNDTGATTEPRDASDGPTPEQDASQAPPPPKPPQTGPSASAGQTNPADQPPKGINDGSGNHGVAAKAAPASPGSGTQTTPGATKPAGPGQSQGQGSKLDAGLSKVSSTPGATSKLGNLAERIIGTKYRTQIRIAIATVMITMTVVGFFLSIPLKMIHIANVLLGFNMSNNDHTTSRGTKRVLKEMFRLKQAAPDGGYKSNEPGRFLKNRLTNMRIDKFNDILAKENLKWEFDGKNRLIGIRDTKTGEVVTDDFRKMSYWEQRRSLGNIVEAKLANGRLIQHALYTKAMRLHAGVSFKFWAKSKAGDLKDRLFSKVRKGLSGDSGLTDGGRNVNDPPTDKNGQPKFQDATSQVEAGSAEAAAEQSVFEKTKDLVAAHKAGIKAVRAKVTAANGFVGLGMIFCMIKELIDNAIQKGYLNRITWLIREGNMVGTMAAQLISGDLNLDDFGEMMSHFDGVPDDPGDPNDGPNKTEDSKDFTQACSWIRASESGQQCSTDHSDTNFSHFNPDLSSAANPDGNDLVRVAAAASAMMNIPGVDVVCKVLNSWFGWVLMGAELTLAVLDGEWSTIATAAVKQALWTGVMSWIVPQLLDAATGLAITGTENAVGLTNNADAGLNLSGKDMMRFMGDRVGKRSEWNKIGEAAHTDQVALAQQKGWTYRVFSIDNNNSIASKIVENVPTSPQAAVAGIKNLLAAIPANFAALFVRPQYAFAGATGDDPYHFRSYVTTDDEIDKYSPTDVEDYLLQKFPDQDGQLHTRLEMLGDPTTYTPANGEDTNKSDLMHCFVGTFRTPYPEDADKICRDLGVLTDRNAIGTVITDPKNPGSKEIMQYIYCDAWQVCPASGITYNDDFDQYRMYLKYVFLTRSLDGLTTDTDPWAGSGETAAVYAICALPAIGADPSAVPPPDDYAHVTVDGVTLNKRTQVMLGNAQRYAAQLGYTGVLHLTQGSYNPGGVDASAGTHDGGGAMDLSVAGMTDDQRSLVVKALRLAGFAAWNRRPPTFPNHIHAIALGDTQASPAAKDQMKAYFLHKDGLAGNGDDPDAGAGYPYPNWAGKFCQTLGLQ